MKHIISFFIFISVCMPIHVQAQSDEYILPYPSYMPGHRLYALSEAWDELQKYWHFGDLSGLKYQRAMTDKYLVQAKTLFEYGQYPLAVDALERSNSHFATSILYLYELSSTDKYHTALLDSMIAQADRHTTILTDLEDALPHHVTWDDERTESYDIPITLLFKKSTAIRDYANR